MQTMDDGVPIAFTRYTPDGAAPAAGRPGVLVLHGLAGNRGSMDAVAGAFANAGYSVLAYDARGHGASGGEITLAGPREVADLRALRNAFAARPEVSDTIGAWGISYGGGQVWNALAAGVPLAAAEVVETWTSLYDALWPQNLARSGIVAGFAAADRGPVSARLRDSQRRRAEPQPRPGSRPCRRTLRARAGSARSRLRSTSSRARSTSPSTSRRRPRRSRASAARRSSTPATSATRRRRSPDVDGAYVLSQGVAWFDRHLKGTRNGVDAKRIVIAKHASATARVELDALPATRRQSFALGGTATARGSALVSRRTPPAEGRARDLGHRHRPASR